MLKAIIFDFDGVIIDSEPIHFEVERQIFETMDILITEHDYLSFTGLSEIDTYKKIKQLYNTDFDENQILNKKIDLFIEFFNQLPEIPVIKGITGFIKKAHELNIKMAIGTSGTREIATFVLKKLQLLQYFSFIISNRDVAKTKPHPDIFISAMTQLKCLKEECLVIEDSENGIKAAKSAGIKVAGYKNNNSSFSNKALPDITVRNFDITLETIIETLGY